MKTALPSISCLCVTKNDPGKLERSIDCYSNQTYSNKELVIVYEENCISTCAFLESTVFSERCGKHNIKLIKTGVEPKLTLGQLRNISLECASGDFFCQWDDDDWFHRDRLSVQLRAALDNYHTASALTHWIIFDEVNRKAYISFMRIWEGSLLCTKNIISSKVKYPALQKEEDFYFINRLLFESKIYPLVCPYLYIYTFHDANTWDRRHFENIIKQSQELPGGLARSVADILENKYPYDEACMFMQSGEFLKGLSYFKASEKHLINA